MIHHRTKYISMVWAVIAVSGLTATLFHYFTPLGGPLMFWLLGIAGGVLGVGSVVHQIFADEVREHHHRPSAF